jgi:hypothetical protein
MSLPQTTAQRPSRSADRATFRRNLATIVGALATLVAVASIGAWRVALAVRPPCPDGYVRLVDFEPVFPWLGAGLAVVGAALTAGARRWARGWWLLGSLALCLGLVASLWTVSAGVSWYTYRHEQYDSCWTF